MFRFQTFKVGLAIFVVELISYSAATIAAALQGVFKVQIVADEMCCNGCAQQVAAQLYALPGVTSVEADVPNRVVTVTANVSPKLTLGRMWYAVEKGKGGPSKLITPQVSYLLTRPDSLKPEQRLPAGRYSFKVRSIEDKNSAQRIANQLYSIRGVQNVSVDIAQRTLFVQAANGTVLSPWTLATEVEQAKGEPIAVAGPYGVLTIERPNDAEPATAFNPTHSQIQGEVR